MVSGTSKDGKPLSASDPSADTAWARVHDLLAENVKLREEIAFEKKRTELVRKGAHKA